MTSGPDWLFLAERMLGTARDEVAAVEMKVRRVRVLGDFMMFWFESYIRAELL
jgi:hypothetical protein